MKNADKFKLVFGLHASELWSMSEEDFLKWLNSESTETEQPEIIRCKDCKHFAGEGMYCSCDIIVQFDHFYCYHAERRTDEQTDRR